jgi:hypothetical protein
VDKAKLQQPDGGRAMAGDGGSSLAPEAGVGRAVASLLQPAQKSTVRVQVKINSAISPLAWTMGIRMASAGAGA